MWLLSLARPGSVPTVGLNDSGLSDTVHSTVLPWECSVQLTDESIHHVAKGARSWTR